MEVCGQSWYLSHNQRYRSASTQCTGCISAPYCHNGLMLELFSTASQQDTKTTGSDNALLKLTTMSQCFYFLNKLLSSQIDEPPAYMQAYYEQTCIILLDCRYNWKCPCFIKLAKCNYFQWRRKSATSASVFIFPYSYFCIHICVQLSLSEGISFTDPPFDSDFVTTLLGIITRPF